MAERALRSFALGWTPRRPPVLARRGCRPRPRTISRGREDDEAPGDMAPNGPTSPSPVQRELLATIARAFDRLPCWHGTEPAGPPADLDVELRRGRAREPRRVGLLRALPTTRAVERRRRAGTEARRRALRGGRRPLDGRRRGRLGGP